MSGFAEVTITAEYHPQEDLFSVLDYKVYYLVCIQGWVGSIVVGVFENEKDAHAFKMKLINNMHRMQSYIDDNIDTIKKITLYIENMRKLDYNIIRLRKKRDKAESEFQKCLDNEFNKFLDFIDDENKRVWEKLESQMNYLSSLRP